MSLCIEGNAPCMSVLRPFVSALIKYGNTQVPMSTPEQLRKDGFKTQTIAVESFSGENMKHRHFLIGFRNVKYVLSICLVFLDL